MRQFALSVFDKINENIEQAQYQTGVRLYKFLEEKKIPNKLGIDEFTVVYKALRNNMKSKRDQ